MTTPLDRDHAAHPADGMDALAFRVSEIGLTASLTALDGLLRVVPEDDAGYGFGVAAETAARLARLMIEGANGLVRSLVVE